MVAFEEGVAGATPADDEIKALPARSKDELRGLIARVKGETKDAGVRDQFEEISPHSYAAVLVNTLILILGKIGGTSGGTSFWF
jgi:hypothetical protein